MIDKFLKYNSNKVLLALIEKHEIAFPKITRL